MYYGIFHSYCTKYYTMAVPGNFFDTHTMPAINSLDSFQSEVMECGWFSRHVHVIPRFEVFTAVNTKMVVLWVVVTCSLVNVYQNLRVHCFLHHQSDYS